MADVKGGSNGRDVHHLGMVVEVLHDDKVIAYAINSEEQREREGQDFKQEDFLYQQCRSTRTGPGNDGRREGRFQRQRCTSFGHGGGGLIR